MGSPDWSRIPYDKLPEWKRQEMLEKMKKKVEKLEAANAATALKCDVCGKEAKNEKGLKIHQSKHK